MNLRGISIPMSLRGKTSQLLRGNNRMHEINLEIILA